MRFLKTLTLNRRAIYDDRLAIDTSNAVIMNTTNNLLLPKGSTAERPTSPVNGMIRYNTTLKEIPGAPGTYYGDFEAYQYGQWRPIRFKEPSGITLDFLGTGDDIELLFGPLTPDPYTYYNTIESGTTWNAAQMALNIVVLVENVQQIGTVNFDIIQLDGTETGVNYPNAPYAVGTYLKFGSPVPLGKDVYVLHRFDQ
jgi:hypothetical protein